MHIKSIIGTIMAACIMWVFCSGCTQYPFPVQEVDPDRDTAPYSQILNARYASLTHDPRAATHFYYQALKFEPDNILLAERAVFHALLANDYSYAVELSKKIWREDLDSQSIIRLTMAVEQMRQGHYEPVRHTLMPSKASGFNAILSRNLRAWASFAMRDYQSADQILRVYPDTNTLFEALNRYVLANLALANGEYDFALKTFEDIHNSGIRLAYSTEQHARLLALKGNREAARNMIQSFIDEVGNNPILSRLINELDMGHSLEPPKLSPMQGAALSIYVQTAVLAQLTQGDSAGAYLTLALALDPDLMTAKIMLADTLDRVERHEEALEMLENIPKPSVYWDNAQIQTIRILHRLSRNEDALERVRSTLAEYPRRYTQIQLASLLVALEHYSEAERVLSNIIDQDIANNREDWQVYFSRGATRERLLDWPRAEMDLSHALVLNPDDAETLNYLGYTWIDHGKNLEEGFRMIQKAARLKPKSGHIIDSLGWAYYRLGMYEKAVEYLEKAVTLLPESPVINDHLGDAYWMVGQYLEAGFQWQHAKNLETDEDLTTKLIYKLENGLPLE